MAVFFWSFLLWLWLYVLFVTSLQHPSAEVSKVRGEGLRRSFATCIVGSQLYTRIIEGVIWEVMWGNVVWEEAERSWYGWRAGGWWLALQWRRWGGRDGLQWSCTQQALFFFILIVFICCFNHFQSIFLTFFNMFYYIACFPDAFDMLLLCTRLYFLILLYIVYIYISNFIGIYMKASPSKCCRK